MLSYLSPICSSVNLQDTPLACPACGSQAPGIFRTNCRDVLHGCPGEWQLGECHQCGLIYTTPALSVVELLNYYPPEYSSYNPVGALRDKPFTNLLRRIAMLPYTLRFGSPDWAQAPFGGGRLLDVGCGAGMFVKEASHLGWQCWGIDTSPVAVEAARRNAPQTTVGLASLDDLVLDERVDFINMAHVLEHLPNPRRVLCQCFGHLTSGGKLRIVVPNIGSLEAKLFGPRWRGLDIPRHLVHFRPAVIERLLRETGYSEVVMRPAMLASSLSESLILTLPYALRSYLFNSRASRLLYLGMVFPASLSYLLGNASAIEVTAQKP